VTCEFEDRSRAAAVRTGTLKGSQPDGARAGRAPVRGGASLVVDRFARGLCTQDPEALKER